ncbi:methyltransferase domain-containing protein [Candidatus Woesearchaeota archaeon]|nr:methyltransferase domain-containing protein [Candidatus Woesearchaeota archaeon]
MKNGTLYSELASLCANFYDHLIDAKSVADFVEKRISRFHPKELLFIGGFFSVAKELEKRGYSLTVIDYTDEMAAEARKRLPGTRIIKADIRNLPFRNEFDAVLAIGRVFTHMGSDEDAKKALQSMKAALKQGGILLFDNYEDTKIGKTPYFTDVVKVKKGDSEIVRTSSLVTLSKNHYLWKSDYEFKEGKEKKIFHDEMEHRAFSRNEIRNVLVENGLAFIEDGDNFDETSFYTLAKLVPKT